MTTRFRRPAHTSPFVRVACIVGMLFSGCFVSPPDLSKINCKDNSSCPSGYICQFPGQASGCRRPTDGGGSEAKSTYDAETAIDLAGNTNGVDGTQFAETNAATDGGSEGEVSHLDGVTPMLPDGSDVSLDGSNFSDMPIVTQIVDSGSDTVDTHSGGGSGGAGDSVGTDSGHADEGNDGTIATSDLPVGNGGAGGGAGGNAEGTGGAGGIASSGGSAAGTSGGTGGAAAGSGGSNDAGADLPGTGGVPSRPAGYWMSSDWSLTGVNWAGCVWTQVDSNVAGSTTSISPQDFTTNHQPSDPYHVSGSVFNDYNSVAMVGFNLNEAITGDSNQCAHSVFEPTTVLPPGVNLPGSVGGLTIDWSGTAPNFRIELRGPNGINDGTQRWCSNITDIAGPTFVPLSSFNTKCWLPSSGAAYNGEMVSSVVFSVPGTVSKKASFDFTISRFNVGYTIGGSATGDSSMQRVKVSGPGGKQYLIQNNNFGNPTASTQTLYYANNSFEVLGSTGTATSDSPASFPSIYVGANGIIASGAYQTTDDNLPMQISAIVSAQSAFTWSGGTGSKDFNAAYDLWFAKTAPTAGSYNDAVSGDLMIWLYKPTNRQPSGSSVRQVTLAGHIWNVWVGARVTTNVGTDGTGRPVVSYVAADSPVLSLAADLRLFINDAVTNGASDMAAAGASQAFASTWYLTDVFGGFEIWTGSDATGLQCTNFTCVVQ